MAIRAIEIGAAGRRLARNLAGLRESRRLSQADLAELVKRLGRQMASDSISKIEKLGRRVDADDLVALAIALDTTPNRLLLPGEATDTELIELTPEVKVTALRAWKWATGEEPLYEVPAPDEPLLIRDDRERQFVRENQPHNRPEPYFRNVGHELRDHPTVVRMLAAVLTEAHERGIPLGSVVRIYEHLDMRSRFGQLDDVLAAISGTGNGDSQSQRQPIVDPEAGQ